MSKLRDGIRDLGRSRLAQFGFATTRAAAAPRRQLLVIAEVADAAAAAQAVADGADALIFGGAAEALPAVVTAAGGAPVGARTEAASALETDAIRQAGADFLVFRDETAAAGAIRDPKLGYVALGVDLTDDGLRLMRLLDLDGVLIAPPAGVMTVRQQLETRRLGDLTRKPLFAGVAAAGPIPDADALEAWRDAGVVAVVAPAETVAALIAATAAVPAPREPRSRREAIVPAAHASELDEDDDDR